MNLTKQQQRVLRTLNRCQQSRGYSPTLRELGSTLKITLNAVRGHLLALQRKRAVTWVKHQARTLQITPEGEEML